MKKILCAVMVSFLALAAIVLPFREAAAGTPQTRSLHYYICTECEEGFFSATAPDEDGCTTCIYCDGIAEEYTGEDDSGSGNPIRDVHTGKK